MCSKAKTNSKLQHRWSPPLEGWIMINVDTSRRQGSKSASIGCNMRDSCPNVVISYGKRIKDCNILVFWVCGDSWGYSNGNSKEHSSDYYSEWRSNRVNSINGNISVPKDIVNLVEEKFLAPLGDNRIEHYHKEINCEADNLAEMAL